MTEAATLHEQIDQLREAVIASENDKEILAEAMRELENQLVEQGWQVIFGAGGRELSKSALNTLYDLARVYWLKNPLIQRAVEVQALYTFAQGMTVKSENPAVNDVIKKFMDDPKNINALTSHLAWIQNERDLRLSGNLFFALFTNQSSGRVIVRTVPLYEIAEIITNPDDAKEPWYYRRDYTVNNFDIMTGIVTPKIETVYYPDWRYNPTDKPEQINHRTVIWDAPIMHVKTNCLPDMKFGVCELYGAIDWAKAYKTHLENGQKLWQALARFAFQLTTKGGATAIAAAKAKIKTLIGKKSAVAEDTETGTGSTRPPVGSVFTSSEGVKLDTIKTSGATIGMDDARRHALMVASGTGIPEQILMGDPSTGNLATAKAMERPLELQFLNRQMLWTHAWLNIMNYIIDQAIRAENGLLDGTEEEDEYTGETIYILAAEEGKESPTRAISVMFPPLLEHDVLQAVQALINGATLDGKPLAGIMDLKTLARQILKALKIENADDLVEKIYPGDILVMQTVYAQQQQANAAAQAQALALQQQRPGIPQVPGTVEEAAAAAAAALRTVPFDIEGSQAYQETAAALVQARRKFAEEILQGLEKNYPEKGVA